MSDPSATLDPLKEKLPAGWVAKMSRSKNRVMLLCLIISLRIGILTQLLPALFLSGDERAFERRRMRINVCLVTLYECSSIFCREWRLYLSFCDRGQSHAQVYYIDVETKKSQWEKPTGPAVLYPESNT